MTAPQPFRTATELSHAAKHLYGRSGGLSAKLQTYRPFICPFEEILPLVPQGARVLDVGCGAGLFLGLLAYGGRLSEGVGFDASAPAIELAQSMRTRLPDPEAVQFLRLDARAEWPAGEFDVLSFIDVLHHVPVPAQLDVLTLAIGKLRPGGLLLYKDMVDTPRWRALANSAHDLLMVREWVHYLPIEKVDAHMASRGMTRVGEGSANRYWYGHEWRVYRRDT
jgi:2-polyprenyl-3-methyl-5-hydroxy-6-metoxy-1,4-benzoquinol methylase